MTFVKGSWRKLAVYFVKEVANVKKVCHTISTNMERHKG